MATDFQVYKILQRTTIISGCNIVIFLKNNCFASFYLHFTLHAPRMVKMKEKPAPGASAGHRAAYLEKGPGQFAAAIRAMMWSMVFIIFQSGPV